MLVLLLSLLDGLISKAHPASELGIEAKFKYSKFEVLVSAAEIPELTAVSESADGLLIGASVTISALENLCKEHVVYAAYCPP